MYPNYLQISNQTFTLVVATTVSSLKYIEMEFPTSNKYLKQRPQKSRAAPN